MKFPYKLIDLTHTLDEAVPGWNNACIFKMDLAIDYHQCSTDVKFRVHTLQMPAGMGTHMDSPSHCIPGGLTIDQLPLTDLIVPCVMIDVSRKVFVDGTVNEDYRVSVEDIQEFEAVHRTITEGSLVVINTGWQKFWSNPDRYRNDYKFPSVSIEAAQLLLTRNIVGLGTDTFSADRPVDEFRVHGAILGVGKYLVENIASAQLLPPVGSFVGVFPLKLKGGSESPIRLIGMIPKNL